MREMDASYHFPVEEGLTRRDFFSILATSTWVVASAELMRHGYRNTSQVYVDCSHVSTFSSENNSTVAFDKNEDEAIASECLKRRQSSVYIGITEMLVSANAALLTIAIAGATYIKKKEVERKAFLEHFE